ncbi:MAG: hypothetical protein CL609_00515 [Anaerolineaceae bacterium]|nr:hypothetical protein [Anaerolineaceae bacterium]
MFYFVIGALVVGYLIYSGLCKLKSKPLKITCPCTFVAASAVAAALYMTDHKVLAWIVLLFGIYLFAISLMALRKVSLRKIDMTSEMIKQ